MVPKLVYALHQNPVKLKHFFGVAIDKPILKCFVEIQRTCKVERQRAYKVEMQGSPGRRGLRQPRPAPSGPLEALVYFLLLPRL